MFRLNSNSSGLSMRYVARVFLGVWWGGGRGALRYNATSPLSYRAVVAGVVAAFVLQTLTAMVRFATFGTKDQYRTERQRVNARNGHGPVSNQHKLRAVRKRNTESAVFRIFLLAPVHRMVLRTSIAHILTAPVLCRFLTDQ